MSSTWSSATSGCRTGPGWDLMRRLRERRAVPGIALTGFGMDDDVSRSGRRDSWRT